MAKKFRLALFALCVVVAGSMSPIDGKPWKKVDLGPAFLRLDILTSGKTTKRMEILAGRADGAIPIGKILYLKPSLLYGHTAHSKEGLFSAGAGLAICVPCTEWLSIAPQIGISYTYLWTEINLPHYMLFKIKERFYSYSPYLGLDLCLTLGRGTRLSIGLQYSRSQTLASIEKLAKQKSQSTGPTYNLQLEHDLSEQWSINVGAAYNVGLSKEKHGLRAFGVKSGIAYWF